jgi:hypothetical protein
MTLRCFICAAFTAAPLVRTMHTTLRAAGVECLSGWADEAGDEPEDLDAFSVEDLRAFWFNNRNGIEQADVVIVLADTPTREGHAEAEYARIHKKQVLWVGRQTLTAAVEGYPRVATPLEAVDVVLGMVKGASHAA